MVFSVMLREGSTGMCRLGLAMTGSDSLKPGRATVTCGAEPVLPNNGLVVVVCVRNRGEECIRLLEAGFAVQMRDFAWMTMPPVAGDVPDPEDIDLD